MNRRSIPELLADLDDVALRCKDAGVSPMVLDYLGRVRDMLWLASQVPESDPHRDSFPPTLEANLPARTAATQAFKNARKILEDVK